MAVQARINGELASRMDDGLLAATISFGSGLVIIGVVTLSARAGRRGLVSIARSVAGGEFPAWGLLGGAAGAALVFSQSATVGLIGVALFSIALVAGQTVSGVLMDLWGVGPAGRVPITVTRGAGAALTLVAVGWSVLAHLDGAIPLWAILAPLLAGIGVGWQQAMNGRVRRVASSAASATLVNFTVGTAVLLLGILVRALVVPGRLPTLPPEPGLYVGGALGCVFIGATALLVYRLGSLLLSLGTVAGQMIASLVIDGVLAPTDIGVPVSTVVSVVLALAAIVVASIPVRPRPRP
ncbi:EamA-like transporter family protein [Mycetocola reblochoni]|uniref:EamA-like transporter family protein n=2 Tax=Mycetocola reblochoni TaxID=331618 RepID=A0A3L6ZKF0_9MICO|nr:EamA-like transporter family protein [Mycetocola reblochoni]